MFSKIFIALMMSTTALASYEGAGRVYGQRSNSLNDKKRIIVELVEGGHYFSALPWMKEYLVQSNSSLDSNLEDAFDKMISVSGVKTFESLPENVLERSRSGNIRYIFAKRLLKKGEYQAAINELNRVNSGHPSYPYVAHMKGVLYAILKKYSEAETQFNDCIRISDKMSGRAELPIQKVQLDLNKDLCVAGVARAQFSSGDYKKADSQYLDIPKNSPVWPEILFEEAWTSYYAKNYNRTLGKLVSYKAPVFDFIFKPEAEVLKALTYMKMCLFDDAKKTADGFYDELLSPSKSLRQFLNSRGKDYRYYYSLMADHEEGRKSALPIVDSILKSIRKDGAYVEMKNALTMAMQEHNHLMKKGRSRFSTTLDNNVKTAVDEYRTLIGAYVRAGLVSKYAELYSAFQGMSYIKLEVLAQRKERLYQAEAPNASGKRGDVKYIERNDKQYFWTFNGEFWADELGDYVFALRSEC